VRDAGIARLSRCLDATAQRGQLVQEAAAAPVEEIGELARGRLRGYGGCGGRIALEDRYARREVALVQQEHGREARRAAAHDYGMLGDGLHCRGRLLLRGGRGL